MKTQKGSVVATALIIAVVVITVVVFGWMFTRPSPLFPQDTKNPVGTQEVMGTKIPWKTIQGQYFEMKAPGEWVEQSPAGADIAQEDISQSNTNEYLVLSDRGENQYVFVNPILKTAINNPENKEIIEWYIDSQTTDSDGNRHKQYSRTEVTRGNNLFTRITIPDSETLSGGGGNSRITDFYLLKLGNDLGLIEITTDNNNATFHGILENVLLL